MVSSPLCKNMTVNNNVSFLFKMLTYNCQHTFQGSSKPQLRQVSRHWKEPAALCRCGQWSVACGQTKPKAKHGYRVWNICSLCVELRGDFS